MLSLGVPQAWAVLGAISAVHNSGEFFAIIVRQGGSKYVVDT